MTTNTSELGKLEPGFLKSIIARTVVGVMLLPVASGLTAMAEHVRSSSIDELSISRVDQFAPQAVFDIVRLSENAPADLEVLKQAIAAKRSEMNEAVSDIGAVGTLLGWKDAAQSRSDAYQHQIEAVQTKIDEIVKDGWQPTEYMKNRTDDQRKLDDIFVQGARTMYDSFIDVQPGQVRSL